MANPNSYCLTISRSGSRIVRLGSRAQIEKLVASYLKAVKAKLPAVREARSLYDALLRRSARLHRRARSLLFLMANCISFRSMGSRTQQAAMSWKLERSSTHLRQTAFTF